MTVAEFLGALPTQEHIVLERAVNLLSVQMRKHFFPISALVSFLVDSSGLDVVENAWRRGQGGKSQAAPVYGRIEANGDSQVPSVVFEARGFHCFIFYFCQ